ncbi:MAG TPA: hypothetical protein VNT75_26325, partial [Symbiobacteriaceae bacterium]|nr:hypothetical protein [Symbiobacteriaceae bacterium]
VLALIFGTGYMDRLHGDAAWPIAIGLTVIWPLGLWPGWWAVSRLAPDLPRWGKIGVYAAGLYLWGALLSVVLYQFSRK